MRPHISQDKFWDLTSNMSLKSATIPFLTFHKVVRNIFKVRWRIFTMCMYKISSEIWQWKNFVNRSTFGEVMIKSQVIVFLTHTVYTKNCENTTWARWREADWLTDFVLCEEVHVFVTSGVSLSDPNEQRQMVAVLLDELLDVTLLRRRRPLNQLMHHRRHPHCTLTHRQPVTHSTITRGRTDRFNAKNSTNSPKFVAT